jgi:hypothetical protein
MKPNSRSGSLSSSMLHTINSSRSDLKADLALINCFFSRLARATLAVTAKPIAHRLTAPLPPMPAASPAEPLSNPSPR